MILPKLFALLFQHEKEFAYHVKTVCIKDKLKQKMTNTEKVYQIVPTLGISTVIVITTSNTHTHTGNYLDLGYMLC